MGDSGWGIIKRTLSAKIDPVEFREWFEPLVDAERRGHELVLFVPPRSSYADFIPEHYGGLLGETLGELSLGIARISFESQAAADEPPNASPAVRPAPREPQGPAGSCAWAKVPTTLLADSRIRAEAKVVWASIATFKGYREMYPSVRTIAARAGLGERAVQRALLDLQHAGFLTVQHGGGRGHTNSYELHAAPKGCQIGTLSAKGCAFCAERVRKPSKKPAIWTPEIDKDIDIEDSSQNSKKGVSLTPIKETVT